MQERFKRYAYLIGLGLVLFSLTACLGSYGRLQRSNDVSKTFERHEVRADHSYYTTGPEARPMAILAVNRAYTLKSSLWRSVDMTPDLLGRLVVAMTDQLGYAPVILGGLISDPDGNQAGLWYSPHSSISIRFEPENTMVVSLPSTESDPIHRSRGRHPGMLP